ncbi:hypothetical protein JIG36_22135 [Actinoplanes sp. LDG1-06]|uniref:Uncharacterized protein n=1 Tax=Paractinoplanes ovalisporus TaxID=2810368 RepID=A0ABS2AFU0_9ACTN|nr:hypothetical protein [Actinoplanes ovalisporus]MBM2618263.1 hypothetical protein [Actinoplanes ovalisporus]
MLSDEERLLLAPHLALLRAAGRELREAERATAEAERDSAAAETGTDWRDRLLGGLFSANDQRSQQYRRARGSRKATEKARDAAREKYETYAVRVDGLLEPLLLREDPAYRAKADAVRACDKALKACEDLRFQIVSTTAKRDDKSWHEAEFGRQRVQEVVREVRAEGPRIGRLLERAGVRKGLDVERLKGPAAERGLLDVQRQLDGLIKELADARRRADQDRKVALRAAYDEATSNE